MTGVADRAGSVVSSLRPWSWVIAGLVVALAVWGWIEVPAAYPLPDAPSDAVRAAQESARLSAIATTRASVLAAAAGLGALVTILINYRNSQIIQRTFALQARGQITERYTKAVEQLGNTESKAIRLGGIYALEQIAVDTDRHSDQQTVVEVLSAFIRELAGAPRSRETSNTDEAAEEPSSSNEPRSLPSDVAAALAVLGRLPQRPGIPRADLSDVDLPGASLGPANLSRADLEYVGLTNANLHHANLTEAHLGEADLTHADLFGADLTHADLHGAVLSHAFLSRANLTGATLVRADLAQARLNQADLTDADLTDADLTGADLTGAKLRGARGLRRQQLSDQQVRAADSLPTELEDA
ncbi:pentapeptide repeat-containing protein [Pseudonocardia acaciae]|uniref:pentapeptide repeat-containing protein n=1 Tax=Pseudonocardia acaciae TaxID=551276 RepID=UPI0007E8C620|nr:pentapeptide repeat-containing protein [Pseudonocardia acaciae]